MRFKVVLEPSEEGGYTVYVPSFLQLNTSSPPPAARVIL